MIKIPGTREGLPAVEQCLSDGINVNITLLFSVENYEHVARTYISALEKRAQRGEPLSGIASVASFFVSRVDSLTDEKQKARMESASGEAERERLRSLMGKAAVANAKIAYAKYQEMFSGPRWGALAAKGARTQRCLWASTSTKNPDYRDVIYVEELIGPDTVNTLPQNTLDAFRDHGKAALTLEQGVARRTRRSAASRAGMSRKAVTDDLQTQGVKPSRFARQGRGVDSPEAGGPAWRRRKGLGRLSARTSRHTRRRSGNSPRPASSAAFSKKTRRSGTVTRRRYRTASAGSLSPGRWVSGCRS
jgi:transaldolase